MSEFEELLEKIREQKPELTKEDIDDKIKQKKEKIGVGYLTDQGALFLIASDLGISLKQTLKVEMGLKDIYVGAKTKRPLVSRCFDVAIGADNLRPELLNALHYLSDVRMVIITQHQPLNQSSL